MTTPAAALHARLLALGPFVGHDPLPPGAATQGWAPLGELVASRDWLAQAVERTRDALVLGGAQDAALVEDRVAASTAHLGVLARLVSPAVGLTALTGRAPDLARHLWLRYDAYRLQAALDYAALADADAQNDAPLDTPLDTLLLPLLITLGEEMSAVSGLAPGIVAGNTASALRGAVTVMRSSSPAHAGPAQHVVEALLRDPALVGAWQVHPGPPAVWRRRSCCLFYRLPQGGLCGDCALTSVPPSRPHAGSRATPG